MSKKTLTPERKNTFHRIIDEIQLRIGFKLLFGICASLGFFLYYWLIVHPEYIRFSQQPIFFLESKFFLEQLQSPGGITDYLAAFCTEAFQFGWIGALILTASVLSIYLLLQSILRTTVWWIVPLVPVLLLIGVQSNQYYFFVKTLALIFSLIGFVFFKKFYKNTGKSFAITVLMFIILYLFSPGAMIVCAILVFLNTMFAKESSFTRRSVISLGVLIVALAIPWIAQKDIFLVSLSSAFLRHSPLWISDTSDIPSMEKIYLELSVIASLIIIVGVSFPGKKSRNILKSKILKNTIQTAIAVALVSFSIWKSVMTDEKEFLTIRYKAHIGDWTGVVELMNDRSAIQSVNLFHFNRAYYHLGKLASDYFSIKQNYTGPGLFPLKDTWYQFPLDYSDFTLELAHVNESKRWAFEALTYYGESTDVLKRLALVHIIEGDFLAGRKFLNRLRQNPFYTSWADHYLECINNPALLRKESNLQVIYTRMPKKDFVVRDNHLEMDLKEILNQHSQNDMAYEYLLMHCLVTHNTNSFIYNLMRYQINAKKPIPRHFKEAVIVFLAPKPMMDAVVAKLGIPKEMVDRYKKFYNTLEENRGNPQKAYSDLYWEYRNTFWFYLIFTKQNPDS